MGERSGQPDGISVMIVDAADLESKATVPLDSGPPGPPTGSLAPPMPQPSAPQPQQAPQPSEPPSPPQAQPQPQPQREPQPQPPREAQPQPQPQPWPKEAMVRAIEPERQAPGQPPEPAPKESVAPPTPSPPPPAPKPKPKTEARAQPDRPLQLSMPDFSLPPGGLGAAVSRPPGITRSGENDEFARNVIRALRKTMPAPSGSLGRVTVRFLLNENGNLKEVALLQGAEDPILTQSVVFAVRQTSFPFPPDRSNVADRTFMVTYVYR